MHPPRAPTPIWISQAEERTEMLEERMVTNFHFLGKANSQKRRKSVHLLLQPANGIRFSSISGNRNSPATSCLNSAFSAFSPIQAVDFLKRRASISTPTVGQTTECKRNDPPSAQAASPKICSRSRSSTMHSPNQSTTFEVEARLPGEEKPPNSSIPSVLGRLASKEHRQERAGQTADLARPHAHFRPIPYEVKAQLDSFFGQSSSQKRELALRTREDGRLWFDRIEQEEFARLLPSTPGSATSFCMSRRSSTAPSASRSPHTITARSRGASFLMEYPAVLPRSPGASDVASYLYFPIPISPFGTTQDDRPSNSYDVASSKRRRKRSPIEIQRGNHVDGDHCLHADTATGSDEQDDTNISMPAFLPLRRHQATIELLAEAFSSVQGFSSSERACPTSTLDDVAQNKSCWMEAAAPQLPLRDGEVSAPLHERRRGRPMSVTNSPDNSFSNDSNPFSDGKLRRRGSSVDLSIMSPTRALAGQQYSGEVGSPRDEKHLRKTEHGKAKADAVLGKNECNERLLVPGGLPTGEHVYDGLFIPCRSVHLASDDEGEEPIKAKKGRSTTSVKAWLKSKTHG